MGILRSGESEAMLGHSFQTSSPKESMPLHKCKLCLQCQWYPSTFEYLPPYAANTGWIMVIKTKVYYIFFCLCKVLKKRLGATTSVNLGFSWLKHVVVLTCCTESGRCIINNHPYLVKMTSCVFTFFYLPY